MTKSSKLKNVVDSIPSQFVDIMVKDLVREDGNWNYEFIQQLLPHGIVLRIVDVLPPYEDGGMDKRMWPGSKLREFTTSNAYYKINFFADLQDEGIWKKIWRIKALDKASFLLVILT